MKRLRNHPSVGRELAEAMEWYENAEPGLGAELVLEVDRALAGIAEGRAPTLAHPEIAAVRRLMLKRFPYWVVVLERSDEFVLVAVAHMKRRPDYWRTRLQRGAQRLGVQRRALASPRERWKERLGCPV